MKLLRYVVFLAFSVPFKSWRNTWLAVGTRPYEVNMDVFEHVSDVHGQVDCVCSGHTNHAGEGGANCTSIYNGSAYCYTISGACSDGKASASVSGTDWSYLACESSQAAQEVAELDVDPHVHLAEAPSTTAKSESLVTTAKPDFLYKDESFHEIWKCFLYAGVESLVGLVLSVIAAYKLSKRLEVKPSSGSAMPHYDDFNSGVCDCFSEKTTCVCSFCCPGAQWALNLGMLQQLPFWQAFLVRDLLMMVMEIELAVYVHLVTKALQARSDRNEPLNLTEFRTIFQEISHDLPWLDDVTLAVMAALAFLGVNYRQNMRSQFEMENQGSGSFVMDCVFHCLCTCCAIAQEARHIQPAFDRGELLVGEAIAIDQSVYGVTD